jgi:uncharacterized protein YjbJ (UPF0337 family)
MASATNWRVIQERYGYAKDQVRRDVDDWYNSQNW